ncbi:hypothetical protein D3C81_1912560 [compost metagenome]
MHSIAILAGAVESHRKALLPSTFAQQFQFGKAVGAQLDSPAIALSKLNAPDLDIAGSDHLLDQIDQSRNAAALRGCTLALQGVELRREVDDAGLLGV